MQYKGNKIEFASNEGDTDTTQLHRDEKKVAFNKKTTGLNTALLNTWKR